MCFWVPETFNKINSYLHSDFILSIFQPNTDYSQILKAKAVSRSLLHMHCTIPILKFHVTWNAHIFFLAFLSETFYMYSRMTIISMNWMHNSFFLIKMQDLPQWPAGSTHIFFCYHLLQNNTDFWNFDNLEKNDLSKVINIVSPN